MCIIWCWRKGVAYWKEIKHRPELILGYCVRSIVFLIYEIDFVMQRTCEHIGIFPNLHISFDLMHNECVCLWNSYGNVVVSIIWVHLEFHDDCWANFPKCFHWMSWRLINLTRIERGFIQHCSLCHFCKQLLFDEHFITDVLLCAAFSEIFLQCLVFHLIDTIPYYFGRKI